MEILNKPKEMEIFENFPAQCFDAVWAKTLQLCDGKLLIYMKLFKEAKYVKPGDEIIIKPGLPPY